jgi:SAM-dependent methyltransferase
MDGVMEHLSDPRGIVRLCYQLLRPGGIFCTIVANDYNPLQQILREQLGFRPWWLVIPEHINYFTIDSLKRTIATSGFEIIQTTVDFPMEIFLLMGENYQENREIGKICHNRRKNFEFALVKGGQAELKSKLYQDFAHHNIGRDIELTARRPM